MATKTTTKSAAKSKTATARKLSTASPSRGGPVKAAAPSSRSSGHAEAKAKEPAKETKSAKSHAPTKVSKPAVTHTPAKPKAVPHAGPKAQVAPPPKPAAKPIEEPKPKAAAPPAVETVSLGDEKKPQPKRPPGDGAVKRAAVLPPISRLRTPEPVSPSVAPPPATAPEAPVVAAEPVAAAAAATEPEVEKKIIHIKPPIVVKELALQLGLKNFQLIKELMDDFNIFATGPTHTVEPDVATQICQKHGFVFEMERSEKGGGVHKVEQVIVAPPPPVIEKEEELKTRGPIITFMGHVDHGKTSLMDAIRKTRVAAGEAGGITQHIGAYTVDYKGTRITFLDTPGHAAFTAMRARGAHVTDIVVIVVAADDGLMPQTLEAISHAKAAPHVKIMVAINKIDLPSANVDRVKKQLQERDLSPEDWGGETIVCEVSATKGTGIDHLLEMMGLQAEVMELKASPTATPRGTVIEAQVEAGRGPTATVIVQMGTLKTGDPFICGDYAGKVKSLVDDEGNPIKEAGPTTPVKVLGFSGLPQAGDEFLVMESERSAKTLSEERLLGRRADKLAAPQRATLESLLEAADGTKHL